MAEPLEHLRLLVGKIGRLAEVTYEIEKELTRAGCSSRMWVPFVDPKILPVALPDCVLKAPAVAAPLHGALMCGGSPLKWVKPRKYCSRVTS